MVCNMSRSSVMMMVRACEWDEILARWQKCLWQKLKAHSGGVQVCEGSKMIFPALHTVVLPLRAGANRQREWNKWTDTGNDMTEQFSLERHPKRPWQSEAGTSSEQKCCQVCDAALKQVHTIFNSYSYLKETGLGRDCISLEISSVCGIQRESTASS